MWSVICYITPVAKGKFSFLPPILFFDVAFSIFLKFNVITLQLMTSEKININFHNLSDDFLIGVYILSLQQVILKHIFFWPTFNLYALLKQFSLNILIKKYEQLPLKCWFHKDKRKDSQLT